VRGEPAGELARLREEFSGDLDVSGATLAASFIRAGLVDAFRLVVHPVVHRQRHPFWPRVGSLEAAADRHRRFKSGVVYLGYESA
jgi:riboflavin biosynthesis pyrimidine reductase